jgi:hypothetical protein
MRSLVIIAPVTTWKIIGSASEDTPADPTPSRVESDARTLLFFVFFGQFPRRAALAALDLSQALQGWVGLTRQRPKPLFSKVS